MNIVEVIPLSRGISKETLTYFSASHIPPGTIVKIPIRKKMGTAIVVSNQEASQARLALRTADFSLKKITSAEKGVLLSPEFVEAGKKTGGFFSCSSLLLLF